MSCALNALMIAASMTEPILAVNPQAQAYEVSYAVAYASCEYQIDPAVIFAVAETESHFDNLRPAGDGLSAGIMQIRYSLWRDKLPPSLFENRSIWGGIMAGSWIIRNILDRGLPLRRYNGSDAGGALAWQHKVNSALRRWRRVLPACFPQ